MAVLDFFLLFPKFLANIVHKYAHFFNCIFQFVRRATMFNWF
jgi:hypothetical protein